MTGDLAQTHAQVKVPIPLYQGKDGVGYSLQHVNVASAVAYMTNATLHDQVCPRVDGGYDEMGADAGPARACSPPG
eukprot:5059203-Pyramimonas_sp.AAC.1